jgi:hypothetical protein
MEQTKGLFCERPRSIEAQAEAAMILKTSLKLTRSEIGAVLDLSHRQVMSRLHRYKYYVASKSIPTAELNWDYHGNSPKAALVEDEQERLEKNAMNRESSAILRADVFEDRLAGAMALHLPTTQTLKGIDTLHKEYAAKRTKAKGHEEVAMATISDAHFGLVNEYFNVEMAKAALKLYLRKVIRLTDLHRFQCPVKTIHVNLLGDNIQGSGANFPNQRWTTLLSAVDQCEVFTEVAVEFIQELLVEFDNVVVNCQYGNHGYLAPKSSNSEPDHANYETLIHRSLAWAFRSNKRVQFNIGKEWFQSVTVFDQRFLLTHGHAVKGAGSLDGIVSVLRKWADILPQFHHVILGHFHRLNRLALPRVFGTNMQRTCYMNGTAVMGDDFIQQFGSAHTNEYWFKFVGPGRVTAEYAVSLYGE